MSKQRHSVVALIIAVSFLLIWYRFAADYGYGALAGTYVLRSTQEKSTLVLNADHSFEQHLDRAHSLLEAKGTWSRYGEAHVSFSHEFIKLEGQELNQSGEAHGEFRKVLGLFPTLNVAPIEAGPIYRRKGF